MSIEHPPKNFDMSREHLSSGERDYVPPKQRSSREISRLHELPHGTLLNEKEKIGLDVMLSTLTNITDPHDLLFASLMMGASLFNSGWYRMGRDTDRMRRVAKVARLGDESGWTETQSGLLTRVLDGLEQASGLADIVTSDHAERRDRATTQEKLGRLMSNVSLEVAALGLGELPVGASFMDLQIMARNQAFLVAGVARGDEFALPTYPSVAQFADADSDVLVDWRRRASNSAYDALDEAYEQIAA